MKIPAKLENRAVYLVEGHVKCTGLRLLPPGSKLADGVLTLTVHSCYDSTSLALRTWREVRPGEFRHELEVNGEYSCERARRRTEPEAKVGTWGTSRSLNDAATYAQMQLLMVELVQSPQVRALTLASLEEAGV